LIPLGLVDLHPLALEDVFHGHSQNRSKADYYTKHLFLRVLCHELVDDASQNGATDHTQVTNTLRTASPEPMDNSVELEEGDQKLKDSDEFTRNGGSQNLGSLNKRRKLGGYPLLPTSRADVKPVYRGNLTKLISNDNAVGILDFYMFFSSSYTFFFSCKLPERSGNRTKLRFTP
jgi:hypothetical protein